MSEDKIIVQPATVKNLLNRFEDKLGYTGDVKEDIEKLFVSLLRRK